ncbi:MAG: UDP binding domain-containing protein, partial [Candidatus Woesearchaeota archaeon]|nr:UDP binding domain-containing protein [Candidatus Woesearchaeota archaeon]
AKYVVDLTVRQLNKFGKPANKSKVLILGLTFKENVKDYRNSKVADIIKELKNYGTEVIAYDPMLEGEDGIVKHEFNITITPLEKVGKVDAIILAVAHKKFQSLTLEQLKKYMPDKPLLIDIKNFYDRKEAEKMGIVVENL